jgi:hypothetical protein
MKEKLFDETTPISRAFQADYSLYLKVVHYVKDNPEE